MTEVYLFLVPTLCVGTPAGRSASNCAAGTDCIERGAFSIVGTRKN